MQGQSTADHEMPFRPDEDARDAAVYWDIRDIQFHCRMGRSTAWRLVRQDGFPAPVVCGKRTVLWPRAEVMVFLEGQREPGHYRREAPPAPTGAASFVARSVRHRAARPSAP